MKKWLSLVAVAVLSLTMTACASFPAKKDTVMAPYAKILVKPLSFEDAVLEKVGSGDQEAFDAAKPTLVKLFNENFETYIKKTGYFDRVLFEGAADADTIVVEPRLTVIDPGIRMVIDGKAATALKLVDGKTGNVIGKYVVNTAVNRPAWGTSAGAIETMIGNMGARAGWYLVDAK